MSHVRFGARFAIGSSNARAPALLPRAARNAAFSQTCHVAKNGSDTRHRNRAPCRMPFHRSCRYLTHGAFAEQ
jgi:hypothetical protein